MLFFFTIQLQKQVDLQEEEAAKKYVGLGTGVRSGGAVRAADAGATDSDSGEAQDR